MCFENFFNLRSVLHLHTLFLKTGIYTGNYVDVEELLLYMYIQGTMKRTNFVP
jgi:hypothetical protein